MDFWVSLWQGICSKSTSVSKWFSNMADSCVSATVAGSHISGELALVPFHFPAVLEEVPTFGDNWYEREREVNFRSQEFLERPVITVEPRRAVPISLMLPIMSPPSDDTFDNLSDISSDKDSIVHINDDAAVDAAVNAAVDDGSGEN